MGIVRKLCKLLGGFLFITFLTLAIFTMTLIQLTEYSNLKPLVIPLLEKMLMEEVDITQINQTYSFLLFACQSKEEIELPLNKENLTLSCAEIEAIEPGNLTSFIAIKAFEKFYFKEYGCDFVECLKEGKEVMLIFSLKANEFFRSIQNLFWMGMLIGVLILFVSVETWQGRLKAFGSSCLFTAIPFFLFGYLKNLILPQFGLPIEALEVVSPIIEKILVSVSNNFLSVLIVGIVLTSSGYLLEHFLNRKKK